MVVSFVVCAYMYIRMYTCAYTYVCMYVCMYVCIYVYTCIYVHVYIYTYIFIDVYTHILGPASFPIKIIKTMEFRVLHLATYNSKEVAPLQSLALTQGPKVVLFGCVFHFST